MVRIKLLECTVDSVAAETRRRKKTVLALLATSIVASTVRAEGGSKRTERTSRIEADCASQVGSGVAGRRSTGSNKIRALKNGRVDQVPALSRSCGRVRSAVMATVLDVSPEERAVVVGEATSIAATQVTVIWEGHVGQRLALSRETTRVGPVTRRATDARSRLPSRRHSEQAGQTGG